MDNRRDYLSFNVVYHHILLPVEKSDHFERTSIHFFVLYACIIIIIKGDTNESSLSQSTSLDEPASYFAHSSHLGSFPTSRISSGFSNIGDRFQSDSKKCFFLFEIQFKRNERLCIGSEDDISVGIGDYVCVTGDRGVDIGKVIQRKPCLQPPSQQALPMVLHKASPIEVSLLKDQRREESCIVRMCNQKAKQHNMDITIVDAEFQYDRKKLTIYYYSNKRVDFRNFVKELYSIYYARIWMENIHTPTGHH